MFTEYVRIFKNLYFYSKLQKYSQKIERGEDVICWLLFKSKFLNIIWPVF